MFLRPNDDSDELSDAFLITRIQEGDLDSYAVLLRRELPRLRSFIALKLPVAHLVDEIAHETFVFAYQNLAGFDVARPFRPWLRAIAWNLVRKELQRYAREQVYLSRIEQAQFARAGSAPVDADEWAYLEECLTGLDPVRRSLVEQKYRDGRDSKEIARMQKRSVEWVRVNLFRVREILRNCIALKVEEHGHAG